MATAPSLTRTDRALGIAQRHEAIPLETLPGHYSVRDTLTGSGTIHITSLTSCDCADFMSIVARDHTGVVGKSARSSAMLYHPLASFSSSAMLYQMPVLARSSLLTSTLQLNPSYQSFFLLSSLLGAGGSDAAALAHPLAAPRVGTAPRHTHSAGRHPLPAPAPPFRHRHDTHN